MLFLRFCTGLLCSPVLAVGGGTIADMFGSSVIGCPMSFWELATWGGSACGPVFAGFTAQRFGYKGPMWELVVLAGFALITIVCLLPETLPSSRRLFSISRNQLYLYSTCMWLWYLQHSLVCRSHILTSSSEHHTTSIRDRQA